MWISSCVVTLDGKPDHSNVVIEALRSIPVFEVGQAIGQRLPVVMEAADGSAARDWHEWITEFPGVVHIDVAFVSFADDESAGQTSPSAQDVALAEKVN